MFVVNFHFPVFISIIGCCNQSSFDIYFFNFQNPWFTTSMLSIKEQDGRADNILNGNVIMFACVRQIGEGSVCGVSIDSLYLE